MLSNFVKNIIYASSIAIVLTIILFLGIFFCIAFAQPSIVENKRSNTIQNGSIDINLKSIPSTIKAGHETKYLISFSKRGSDSLQRHIDFGFTILKNNTEIFNAAKQASLPLLHSARGGEVIPFTIAEPGKYTIRISINGINFVPILTEYIEFFFTVV
jgi:hypothetical protein